MKESTIKLLESNKICENLKVKTKLLEEKNDILLKENEVMSSRLLTLKDFEEAYKKFNKKLVENFSDGSIEKFFQKYEYLENVCLDLTKRKLELEDDQLILEKEKQTIKNTYENTIDNLYRDSHEKEKFIKSLKGAQDAKNLEFEENIVYKAQYMNLFNLIMELYTKWSENCNIFSSSQKKEFEFPNKILNTPEEILGVLDKIITISTPQSAQTYIRKIIASAFRLLRKFMPEKLSEMYEPEKVYEHISSYINKLLGEVKKLKNEIFNLKQKNDQYLKDLKKSGIGGKKRISVQEGQEYIPLLFSNKNRRKALKLC